MCLKRYETPVLMQMMLHFVLFRLLSHAYLLCKDISVFFFFDSCIKQLDMRIYDAEYVCRLYNTASSDDKTYLFRHCPAWAESIWSSVGNITMTPARI